MQPAQLAHGLNEGRRASAEFDPVYYVATTPSWGYDIYPFFSNNYWNAALHYLAVGREQGRRGADPDFNYWARSAGVQVLSGDFDADGRSDVALVGAPGWETIPIAHANADGSWRVTNRVVADFPGWASVAGAKAITGDFDGNGCSDILLTGAPGWERLPIAFAQPDGSFIVSNQPNVNFAYWASVAGAQIVAGRFDADGFTDFAITGPSGWTTVLVALSNGDGTFREQHRSAATFASLASTSGAKAIAGDFDANGYADIALTGANNWSTLPILFSQPSGSVYLRNRAVADFPYWASISGAKPIAGDFNNDGGTDIALTGPSGWGTIPVALSWGNGLVSVTNRAVPDFPAWASVTGAQAIGGDFNGDNFGDISLAGVTDWSTIPVAQATGGGNFSVVNHTP